MNFDFILEFLNICIFIMIKNLLIKISIYYLLDILYLLFEIFIIIL